MHVKKGDEENKKMIGDGEQETWRGVGAERGRAVINIGLFISGQCPCYWNIYATGPHTVPCNRYYLYVT